MMTTWKSGIECTRSYAMGNIIIVLMAVVIIYFMFKDAKEF